jgi:hypothetical protein
MCIHFITDSITRTEAVLSFSRRHQWPVLECSASTDYSRVELELRLTVVRPARLRVGHPFGALDQILIFHFVRQLLNSSNGAPSLTIGRVSNIRCTLILLGATQGPKLWRALVSAVMNLLVPYTAGECLRGCTTSSVSVVVLSSLKLIIWSFLYVFYNFCAIAQELWVTTSHTECRQGHPPPPRCPPGRKHSSLIGRFRDT